MLALNVQINLPTSLPRIPSQDAKSHSFYNITVKKCRQLQTTEYFPWINEKGSIYLYLPNIHY